MAQEAPAPPPPEELSPEEMLAAAVEEVVLEEFPSAADMSEEELVNECFIDCDEEGELEEEEWGEDEETGLDDGEGTEEALDEESSSGGDAGSEETSETEASSATDETEDTSSSSADAEEGREAEGGSAGESGEAGSSVDSSETAAEDSTASGTSEEEAGESDGSSGGEGSGSDSAKSSSSKESGKESTAAEAKSSSKTSEDTPLSQEKQGKNNDEGGTNKNGESDAEEAARREAAAAAAKKKKEEEAARRKQLKLGKKEATAALKKAAKLKASALRAALNKRLRSSGFARTRGGYLPPGVSPKEVEQAAKLRKAYGQNKALKPPPHPTIGVSPLTPEGGVDVKFTQEMLAPEKGTYLRPKIYNSVMDVGVSSKADGSGFKGGFGTSKKQRRLAAAELEGEAAKMAFVPVINEHNSTGYSVALEFDDPAALSIGGAAELDMEIKEVSVFKTKATLTAMDAASFESGKPEIGGGLPPIIADPEAAEELEATSESAADAIQGIMSSNFFVGVLLGGSMQELWGMIRALQMISLSALVTVNIPTHLHLYLAICVVFAQMDLFSGEALYDAHMVFKPTKPPSEQFAFFGIETSNFMMNSGSYFVIQGALLLYYLSACGLNKVSAHFPRSSWARKVGMRFYEDNYCREFAKASCKLFLESYFDIVMCVMLNSFAFFKMSDGWQSFFETRDDAICSSITLLYTAFILSFPAITGVIIHRNQGRLGQDLDEFLEVVMEGVDPHSYHASMYTVYFLWRRLATGFVLLALVDYPFFQSTFLMIFSTMNFIYISSVRPMDTKRENLVEIVNELSILVCAHLYSIFLRGDGGPGFIGAVGWAFMGASILNILFNLTLIVTDSLVDGCQGCYGRIFLWRRTDMLKERARMRKKIFSKVPNLFRKMEQEEEVIDAVKVCKAWLPHRRWLKANNLKFDDFEEEIEFQALCRRCGFEKRATAVAVSRSMQRVAEKLAREQIAQIRAQNAMIRDRKAFLER